MKCLDLVTDDTTVAEVCSSVSDEMQVEALEV